MLSSAEYVHKKGVRIAEPYLIYYALFNTSPSAVLMIPEQPWQGGNLLDSATHMKVINLTTELLRQIAPTASDAYKVLAQNALASRELFSYKFPAQGLKGKDIHPLPDFDDVAETCGLIAEIAQLTSECVETEFAPLAQPYGDFGEYPLKRYFEYKHRFGEVIDDDDYHRLGQALCNHGAPVSLASTATEGLVEDFFFAWDFGSEDDRDSYRPDQWQLIFPFV